MSNNDLSSNKLEEILGDHLISNTGEAIPVASVGSKKMIIMYFSAHWCPVSFRRNCRQARLSRTSSSLTFLQPCRFFTPQLSAAYADYKKRIAESKDGLEADDSLEIVFVSSDSTMEEFEDYHKEMAFPALPYGRRDLKENLSEKFGVEGIPTLVAINPQTGELMYSEEEDSVDFRSLVMEHGGSAFPFTKERLAQLEHEAKAKQAQALDSIGGFDVTVPGSCEDTKKKLSDLLSENEYVTFVFGDGDAGDSVYTLVQKTLKETTSLPVYVGFSLYDENSDHAPLAKRFHSLTTILSEEQKDILKHAAGGCIEGPLLLTIRQGKGNCHKDGSCEKVGAPVVVSTDLGMGAVRQFGASAFPWDANAIKIVEKAKEERVAKLKKLMPGFQFLNGAENKGTFLKNKDQQPATTDELADFLGEDGVLGLYFSAHWCPPCKRFSAKLVTCYESLREADKKLEIVFLSSDGSEEEFDQYYSSMVTETGRQWLSLDYAQRDLKNDLEELFGVEGIPTLVLIKKDGTIISTDGTERIEKFGPGAFPWDDVGMQMVKDLFVEKEKIAVEEQRLAGGIVLKRVTGEPVSVMHMLPDRRFLFQSGFSTISAPDAVVKSGISYYELEIQELAPCTQFGFTLAGEAVNIINDNSDSGVGDDAKSWAVDGHRELLWHDGAAGEFPCSWKSGDVVGFAVNVELGKIAVSKNGKWSEDGCGVVFQSNSISSNGVYPSFSASGGNKLVYNMQEKDWTHAPPSAEVWQKEATKAE